MKLAAVVTLRGWQDGSGWSYEESYGTTFEDYASEAEARAAAQEAYTSPDWSWYDGSNDRNGHDTQIKTVYYLADDDGDYDCDEPLYKSTIWGSDVYRPSGWKALLIDANPYIVGYKYGVVYYYHSYYEATSYPRIFETFISDVKDLITGDCSPCEWEGNELDDILCESNTAAEIYQSMVIDSDGEYQVIAEGLDGEKGEIRIDISAYDNPANGHTLGIYEEMLKLWAR